MARGELILGPLVEDGVPLHHLSVKQRILVVESASQAAKEKAKSATMNSESFLKRKTTEPHERQA